MKQFFVAMFIFGLLFAGTGTAHAVNYSYTYLDIPGEAADMNDDGMITGSYTGDASGSDGFIFSGSSWTKIIYNDWEYADLMIPYSINNNGFIAGTLVSSVAFGFTYDSTNFTVMAPSTASETLFFDMNDQGIIVGSSLSWVPDFVGYQGFSFDGTTYTWLKPPWLEPSDEGFWPSYINNQGTIVGQIGHDWFSVRGNIWTLLEYPGSAKTDVSEINNLGVIVGQWTDSAGGIHAFRYNGTSWISGDYPGAIETIAYDINDKGMIVGTYVDTNGQRHGFSYASGVWSRIDYPDATETTARLINNNGWIIGSFTKDGREGQFQAKPVTSVKIDIKPNNSSNYINYRGAGTVAVAIFGSNSFRPFNILNTTSLTFGRTGDEVSLSSCSPVRYDVNFDGYADIICQFSIPKAGFKCGDTSGTIKGRKTDGNPVEGKSYVRITGCY